MSSPSYYAFPPSSPYTGVGPNAPPDRVQTPSSAITDKLQAYPPDVYTNSPPAIQPLHPYPTHPARFTGRTYSRPESPGQIGRAPSVWTAPQGIEGPTPVQKTFKTFLQWKAEAQATTAEYQRIGFSSPVAWVLYFNHFSILRDSRITQVYVEGHAIPPNAIIGGVDRRGPWHIARAFYEVRLPHFLHRDPSLTSGFVGCDG